MAYATQDDLVPDRITLGDLTELTADDDSEGPDPDVVNGALTRASATIDGYCGQRYTTPLQPSVIVTGLCVDLALFDIASRRRDTKPTETWTQRYSMAMSFLRDIAAGKASLDQPASAQEPQGSSADVTTSKHRLTFDDHHLRGFC